MEASSQLRGSGGGGLWNHTRAAPYSRDTQEMLRCELMMHLFSSAMCPNNLRHFIHVAFHPISDDAGIETHQPAEKTDQRLSEQYV